MDVLGLSLVFYCAAMVTIFALSWWSFKTLSITAQQRRELIEAVFAKWHDGHASYLHMFEQVDFDAHLRAVTLRRDPYQLYAPPIRRLIQLHRQHMEREANENVFVHDFTRH